jgi:hypothetical protein
MGIDREVLVSLFGQWQRVGEYRQLPEFAVPISPVLQMTVLPLVVFRVGARLAKSDD